MTKDNGSKSFGFLRRAVSTGHHIDIILSMLTILGDLECTSLESCSGVGNVAVALGVHSFEDSDICAANFFCSVC